MGDRVHYLRRKSYNTRSNKIRKQRTPGGRLAIKYVGKTSKGPQTSINTKSKLTGLQKLSNSRWRGLSHTQRTISRPYGGVLTPCELKDKIKRAFLIEEVKIVKKIFKEQNKK